MDALQRKIGETEQAMVKTSGVILEVFTNKEVFTAGDEIKAAFNVYAVGKLPVTVVKVALKADQGDVVEKEIGSVIRDNAVAKDELTLKLDERTPVSRIFWSTNGKVVNLEDPDPAMILQPFRDYPVVGYAQVQIGSSIITIKQPVQNRIRNVVLGEERTNQAESDSGRRAGLTTDDRSRLKELERENRELKRANEILRKASAYFAQAELDRRRT